MEDYLNAKNTLKSMCVQEVAGRLRVVARDDAVFGLAAFLVGAFRVLVAAVWVLTVKPSAVKRASRVGDGWIKVSVVAEKRRRKG